MKLSDFDYALPRELIAQVPLEPRDASKLMVISKDGRDGAPVLHKQFFDLPEFLTGNDVLVFNQSKVIPARVLFTYRERECEIFFLRVLPDGTWEAMVRPGKFLKDGVIISLNEDITFEIVGLIPGSEHGHRAIRVYDLKKRGAFEILEEIGTVPLPPYIESQEGAQLYQTIYATRPGSVAAPTAGFHFTTELMDALTRMGVQTEYVTLHVGAGTFLPVTTESILDHQMHEEFFEVDSDVADRLIDAKRQGKRIIGVGTTSCRTLESCFADPMHPVLQGDTRLFIYPGYSFRFIDGLITNFHLPKSTLLMLVSAMTGRERILACYQEAVREEYRFFSFGDGMLIV